MSPPHSLSLSHYQCTILSVVQPLAVLPSVAPLWEYLPWALVSYDPPPLTHPVTHPFKTRISTSQDDSFLSISLFTFNIFAPHFQYMTSSHYGRCCTHLQCSLGSTLCTPRQPCHCGRARRTHHACILIPSQI